MTVVSYLSDNRVRWLCWISDPACFQNRWASQDLPHPYWAWGSYIVLESLHHSTLIVFLHLQCAFFSFKQTFLISHAARHLFFDFDWTSSVSTMPRLVNSLTAACLCGVVNALLLLPWRKSLRQCHLLIFQEVRVLGSLCRFTRQLAMNSIVEKGLVGTLPCPHTQTLSTSFMGRVGRPFPTRYLDCFDSTLSPSSGETR